MKLKGQVSQIIAMGILLLKFRCRRKAYEQTGQSKVKAVK
jgi:hypothetical protein